MSANAVRGIAFLLGQIELDFLGCESDISGLGVPPQVNDHVVPHVRSARLVADLHGESIKNCIVVGLSEEQSIASRLEPRHTLIGRREIRQERPISVSDVDLGLRDQVADCQPAPVSADCTGLVDEASDLGLPVVVSVQREGDVLIAWPTHSIGARDPR